MPEARPATVATFNDRAMALVQVSHHVPNFALTHWTCTQVVPFLLQARRDYADDQNAMLVLDEAVKTASAVELLFLLDERCKAKAQK
jgi:hypothetical protein